MLGRVLHIKMINIVLLEYNSIKLSENVIARSTTRCLCVGLFLMYVHRLCERFFPMTKIISMGSLLGVLNTTFLSINWLFIAHSHSLFFMCFELSLSLSVIHTHMFEQFVHFLIAHLYSMCILFLSQKIKRSLLFTCTRKKWRAVKYDKYS